MEFVVSVPLCPLYAAASAGAERVDELLCGWSADILEELSTGWCRVRTAYRYEGGARRECLRPAGSWAGREDAAHFSRLIVYRYASANADRGHSRDPIERAILLLATRDFREQS